MNFEDLSEGGKKLVELCGVPEGFSDKIEEGKIAISQAIKENPELVSAIDEYVQYRETEVRAIEKKSTIPSTKHSLAKK